MDHGSSEAEGQPLLHAVKREHSLPRVDTAFRLAYLLSSLTGIELADRRVD